MEYEMATKVEQWKGETVKRWIRSNCFQHCHIHKWENPLLLILDKSKQHILNLFSCYSGCKLKLHRYTLFLISLIIISLPQLSPAKRLVNLYPLPKSYYREASMYTELQQLSKDNPERVQLHTIGKTATNKKAVYALQIQTDIDRIPVLVVGQHHGDEVIGVEISMALAKQLIYSHDPKISRLLEVYSFWIVPTLNPEAYSVVTSGKNEWKRKNNTDTNRNGRLDIKTDGVDLNRNYPTFWNMDSPLPESSFFYKGKSPASENEVKSIIELASIHQFKYAFFYHSSVTGILSEKIYLPWQDKKDKSVRSDFDTMRNLAEVYAASVPKDYKPGTYSVFSGNTSRLGNSRNHFFYEYGTYSFDIEVCGVNKAGVGIVHPDAATKDIIARKNVKAIVKTLSFVIADENPAW